MKCATKANVALRKDVYFSKLYLIGKKKTSKKIQASVSPASRQSTGNRCLQSAQRPSVLVSEHRQGFLVLQD